MSQKTLSILIAVFGVVGFLILAVAGLNYEKWRGKYKGLIK